jgi:hypothetical protein
MGCEPRGFGWSATVEVCSARVTRLVTDQEKSKKFSAAQLVPGTGRVAEICQHFDSGVAMVPGTGRVAEICQHFDWGGAMVPGTGLGGLIPGLLASGHGGSRCLHLGEFPHWNAGNRLGGLGGKR